MAGRLLDLLLGRPWIALAAALVVHAALWLAVQRDIHTADPLYYATNAHHLAFHPAGQRRVARCQQRPAQRDHGTDPSL